jgi:hypothetical protein
MKIAVEVNHALTINVRTHVKKIHVDLMQSVLFPTKELVVLARLQWFQAQPLKLDALDHQLYPVLKIETVLKVLLVSTTIVDPFVLTVLTV